jgi:hypothetical protein
MDYNNPSRMVYLPGKHILQSMLTHNNIIHKCNTCFADAVLNTFMFTHAVINFFMYRVTYGIYAFKQSYLSVFYMLLLRETYVLFARINER